MPRGITGRTHPVHFFKQAPSLAHRCTAVSSISWRRRYFTLPSVALLLLHSLPLSCSHWLCGPRSARQGYHPSAAPVFYAHRGGPRDDRGGGPQPHERGNRQREQRYPRGGQGMRMPALVCSGDLRFALPFRFFVARTIRDAISLLSTCLIAIIYLCKCLSVCLCVCLCVCVCMYV